MVQTLIFLAALSCLIIGVMVIRSGVRSATVRAFVVFVFLTGAWSAVNLVSGWVLNEWTLRLTFVIGAWIPTCAIYWVMRFSHPVISSRLRWALGAFAVGSLAVGIAVLATDWIAVGTATEIQLGPAFPVYALLLLVGIVTTIGLCVRHYRRSEGVTRLQTRYILLGVGLFGLSAFLVSGLLPALGVSATGRLDSVSSLFFVGCSAYAIVRHRLMDTRLILRLSVIYLILGIFTLLMYYGVLWLDNHVFGGSYSLGGYLSGLIFAPLFLASLNVLSRHARRAANHYFFASLYDSQTVLDTFATRVSSTINLPDVLQAILNTIVATMRVDDVAVAIRATGQAGSFRVAARVGFAALPDLVPVESRIQRTLRQTRSPVSADDATDRSTSARSGVFASKSLAVVVPLVAKDQIVAVILVGRKVSHDAFTSQDMPLLQAIANQSTIAIQNARLYDQVQNFSQSLEEKVKEQTRDIEEKNQSLEALLRMKSEFLAIASHQLRTPLTAIRGLLSMLVDGDFDAMPKREQKTQHRNMLASADRLSNIVNDLLDAMELEGGNLNFAFTDVDLGSLVDGVCADLKPNYDAKGLTLTFQHPPATLPSIQADPKMLREAIMNIVDNAEKYTNKGGTTISLQTDDSQVVLTVTDTGIGIPESDFHRLFQKFSRGEKSTYQHTDGSGLGLFIVKSIISEHHGTITVTSPGEGKGAVVSITLPVRQPAGASHSNAS